MTRSVLRATPNATRQPNGADKSLFTEDLGKSRLSRMTILGFALALKAVVSDATVFELPADGSNVVGSDMRITAGYTDTLLDIARQYSLGYEEIIRANPNVDMWLPGEGTQILLPGRRILPPGQREGVVINIPEHRLYFYPRTKKGEKPIVITYPISAGKIDKETPLGRTRIIAKVKNPSWYPPASIRKEHEERGDPLPRVVPPGSDNPLGMFAMRLEMGDGTYLIHGTNNPVAVGMAVTHGCVRMYPEDIAALFPLVPVGTRVALINEPIKLAHANAEFWLESHPAISLDSNSEARSLEILSQLLVRLAGDKVTAIHWDFAREALRASTGVTSMIGLELQSDAGAESPTPPNARSSGSNMQPL